jgi:hypothetical protein
MKNLLPIISLKLVVKMKMNNINKLLLHPHQPNSNPPLLAMHLNSQQQNSSSNNLVHLRSNSQQQNSSKSSPLLIINQASPNLLQETTTRIRRTVVMTMAQVLCDMRSE